MQWNDAPNEAYEKLYKTFVRTPVRYKENKVDEEAVYDDPKDIFPNSYVDSKEIQYGKEDPKTKSMNSLINSFSISIYSLFLS